MHGGERRLGNAERLGKNYPAPPLAGARCAIAWSRITAPEVENAGAVFDRDIGPLIGLSESRCELESG